MELYKGVTILYLLKPKEGGKPEEEQFIYHCFYNGIFQFEEAETIEELERLAKSDIDNKFNDKEE